MSNAREELKEQLRAMAAGEENGIDINTANHWVVEGLEQPTLFFAQLINLLPAGAILYFEGTGIVPEVGTFYLV